MSEPPDETPDVATIARRFMDLWEAQAASLAQDSELAALIDRFAALQAASVATILKGMPSAGAPFATGETTENDDEPARPPAPAPSSGGGDDRLDELARRLAECEERLARLERQEPRAGSRAGDRRGKP